MRLKGTLFMLDITIAIVAYNEESYLPRLLGDILDQTYPHDHIEVLFVDSASTDGTRIVMHDFAKAHDGLMTADGDKFKHIAIFENPKKRLSAGCNIAIKEFTTDALVRVDAHARIPNDFIAECVAALGDESDETFEYVVGGARPTVCESDSAWSKTLWMAEESMFGSSVSQARRVTDTSDHEHNGEYVSSIFHVCYRKKVAEDMVGFREDLGRTEDNEFYYRLRKNGYKIYRSPYIYSEQYIRPSLGKMLKQKWGNGYWIGRTLGIVPGCISVYHLIPFAFILAIIGCTVFAICGFPDFIRLLGALYGSVAILMAVYSAFSMQRQGQKVPPFALLLPFIFLMLHVVYGVGTFVGILSIPFGRKRRSGK